METNSTYTSRLDADYPAGFAASIDLAGTPDRGAIGNVVRSAGGVAITIVPATAQSHGIPFIQVQRSEARLSQLLADNPYLPET